MSANTLQGDRISPHHRAGIWSLEALTRRLDSLARQYRLQGPVGNGGRTFFREVDSAGDMNLGGGRTMISPVKTFFHPPVRTFCSLI